MMMSSYFGHRQTDRGWTCRIGGLCLLCHFEVIEYSILPADDIQLHRKVHVATAEVATTPLQNVSRYYPPYQ